MASESAQSCKKLLVLDVKGFLLDAYQRSDIVPGLRWDAIVNNFYVYKRPYCFEFIQFCLDHFIVGIWSAAREYNVQGFVDFLFPEKKEELAFVWHQGHCTNTGLKHPENENKPVFFKDLNKLWRKTEDNLPWTIGEFGSHNTLLIDDSAYKAIQNPEHTGIFPKVYKVTEGGVEGEILRVGLLELQYYLTGLYESPDVQQYVSVNPFGNPGIDAILRDPLWRDIVDAWRPSPTPLPESRELYPDEQIVPGSGNDDVQIPLKVDNYTNATWAPASSVV